MTKQELMALADAYGRASGYGEGIKEARAALEAALDRALAPVDAQPLGDLTGVRVCCGEYTKCFRPCTPRGRWEVAETK